MTGEAGGRIFFSSAGRSLEQEDEIRLTSVGVDIGSSTTHLAFSRITLERLDNRYIVAQREVLHESDVLLTPYAEEQTIDASALGRFIARQYATASVDPASIDTGALILTGVAVRRRNARAIGELFASQAGKLVAVSAGDALEATLAAHGSGAIARSIRESARVMNVDIGGGTSKIAVCERGEVVARTAIDVGARLVAFDETERVVRIEDAARRFASEAGVAVELGSTLDSHARARLADAMAGRLLEAMRSRAPSDATAALLRLAPLADDRTPDVLTFSGGVSEYLYGRERATFGDLGPELARAVRERATSWGPRIESPEQRLRATVIGASQYTIQVSGSTIFVDPADALPLRNVPVIAPALALDADTLDIEAIATSIRTALEPLGSTARDTVALGYRFEGSATFTRLRAFCESVVRGLAPVLDRGAPLVLVGERDVGGLIGLHLHDEMKLANAIVSIDGVRLRSLDFIDVGALLPASGAVPVVVRSLVFPPTATPDASSDRAPLSPTRR